MAIEEYLRELEHGQAADKRTNKSQKQLPTTLESVKNLLCLRSYLLTSVIKKLERESSDNEDLNILK